VKPLALDLAHFGPFVRHAVDLEAFSTDGIFLIHGDTGAGKSTLLDAIAWALYGRGLGARERDDHLRSKTAPADEATAVSLTFALGERVYKVRRAMGFERPAKRGGGVTRQPPEAVLECLSGDDRFVTVASPRKVDAEIERLLGLPYEQFTRIIVLPQGEFRDLLLARAEDRERLLERLFGTELYKSIEVALRDAERDLERDLGEGRARLDAALRGVGATTRDELSALRADTDAMRTRAESAVRVTESSLATAEKSLRDAVEADARNRDRAAARASLAALDAHAPEVVERARTLDLADRAALCDDAAERHARAEERAERAVAAHVHAKAELAESTRLVDDPELAPAKERARLDAREAAREKRTRLEQLQRELEDVASSERALDHARSFRDSALAQLRELDAQAARTSAAVADKQRTLDEGRRAEQQLPAAILRVEEVDRRVQALRARVALEEQLREVSRTLRGAERQVAHGRERLAKAREERDRTRDAERSVYAAILARALHEGAPCPVCGSHEHPSPAAESPSTPAPEARRDAETAHDDALAALGKSESEHARLEGERDAVARQLDTQRGHDPASAEELDEARRAAASALDEVRRAKRSGDDAERAIAALRKDLSRIEASRVQPERTAAEATATIAQLEPRVAAARARLAEDGVDDATLLAAVDAARREESKLADEVESMRARRTALETRRSRAAAAFEHAERARDDAEAEVEARAAELTQTLESNGFSSFEAMVDARRTTAERASMREAVATHRAARTRAEDTLASLGPDEPAGDVAALESAATAARAANAEAQREVGTVTERATQLAGVATRVEAWATQSAEAERRWQVARKVSDAVNGRHEGKTRLSRYVLLEQFDRVTACASARLDMMSDGRFTLRRRESRQTGGEFELVVDDAYAGSVERPVATLSGGEMFMASLAMALGLSDVVQAWAGGVRVESLFVDEGFGTLDEEALDKAVSVLESLGEQRRMVGVVSHVPELRKRIAARLEVVRTDRGAATRSSLRGRHRG
jgi:DNA repair protein SbcC/Rad50